MGVVPGGTYCSARASTVRYSRVSQRKVQIYALRIGAGLVVVDLERDLRGSLPRLADTANAEWWPKAGLMKLRDQLIRGRSRGRAP